MGGTIPRQVDLGNIRQNKPHSSQVGFFFFGLVFVLVFIIATENKLEQTLSQPGHYMPLS